MERRCFRVCFLVFTAQGIGWLNELGMKKKMEDTVFSGVCRIQNERTRKWRLQFLEFRV